MLLLFFKMQHLSFCWSKFNQTGVNGDSNACKKQTIIGGEMESLHGDVVVGGRQQEWWLPGNAAALFKMHCLGFHWNKFGQTGVNGVLLSVAVCTHDGDFVAFWR